MNSQPPVGCLLFVVPSLLVVSSYLAWWELRFLIQGLTIDATVDGAQEIRLRRWMFGGPYLEVRYSFQDAKSGHLRTEHDDLPLWWPRPGATVGVEYVPNSPGGSRLEGHRHIVMACFFVVCLIASLVYAVFVLRDARRAVREEETFEAKRRRNPHG